MLTNHFDTDTLLEEDILTEVDKQNSITLFNDNVNTFEWVIECLMNYCSHDNIQAEQCAYIVHFNGKCIVKKVSFEKLKPICETLLEKGLTAEIN
jgi:ATP-dependent Clp protease adaptor protein ClpS